MTELEQYLHKIAGIAESTLDELLPKEDTYPASIHNLMRYSIFAGGKRIRPALVAASFEACGSAFPSENVLKVGAAIEMLHTFSLIHDDLPCMDDDDFRRGRPTAHKAFNEALAVLGGDALCIYAYEILANVGSIAVISEISRALGTNGMIGGQVVDIESEGKAVDKATVEYIHMNKTAALIRACIRCGALLANADSVTTEKLTNYGNLIGLAFQVVDDILDETATTEQLGKDAGSDRENGKATWVSVCGMDESRRYAVELIDKAKTEISFLGENGRMLAAIADFFFERVN